MLTVHASQQRKVGEVRENHPNACDSSGSGPKAAISEPDTCHSENGEEEGGANSVTYAKLTLTVHQCSKAGGAWRRYSSDTHSSRKASLSPASPFSTQRYLILHSFEAGTGNYQLRTYYVSGTAAFSHTMDHQDP